MHYIKRLSANEKKDLASYMNTSVRYLYRYMYGYRIPSPKRAKQIVQWASKNTPGIEPTFEQLLLPEKS